MEPLQEGFSYYPTGASALTFQDGQRLCFTQAGRSLTLLKEMGSFVCVDAHCFHMGGPIGAEGDIEALGDRVFLKCPWHGRRIDLETGKPLTQEDVDPGVDPNIVQQRLHPVHFASDGSVWVALRDPGQYAEPAGSDRYSEVSPTGSGAAIGVQVSTAPTSASLRQRGHVRQRSAGDSQLTSAASRIRRKMVGDQHRQRYSRGENSGGSGSFGLFSQKSEAGSVTSSEATTVVVDGGIGSPSRRAQQHKTPEGSGVYISPIKDSASVHAVSEPQNRPRRLSRSLQTSPLKAHHGFKSAPRPPLHIMQPLADGDSWKEELGRERMIFTHNNSENVPARLGKCNLQAVFQRLETMGGDAVDDSMAMDESDPEDPDRISSSQPLPNLDTHDDDTMTEHSQHSRHSGASGGGRYISANLLQTLAERPDLEF